MEDQRKKWKGRFIWQKTEEAVVINSESEILYFRKTFDCSNEQSRFEVHISADSRYRLYINGKSILSGPCKGSEYYHYYETLNLIDYLVPGKNVIAVKVLHYPPVGENISVRRFPLGMLIFDGELSNGMGSDISYITSDESWLCFRDRSVSFLPGEYNTMFLGGAEHVDGSLLPHGWEAIDFDDSDWDTCRTYDLVDTSTGVLEPWQLTRREIPFMREEEKSFAGVKYFSGITCSNSSLFEGLSSSNDTSVFIESNASAILEIDAGLLTTGFPILNFSKGAGTTVKLLYAECYENEPIEIPWERNKQIRDDQEKGKLYGDFDTYILSGSGTPEKPELYSPFWFKTFRFIRLEINSSDEAVCIHNFKYLESTYPLEVKADFSCSDPSMNPLWSISLNTLQKCMHETYEDCPYYEQYQYAMDTYVQTLFTYNVSGDDRLARKAIHDYHCSLLPQGLLQSRFPSIEAQIIPGFNIFWIMMIFDHYLYFRDREIISRYSSTIDSVLSWFDRNIDQIPYQYWQFVDWVPQWREGRGVPSAAAYGPLTVYRFMYSVGLQKAADLNEVIGRTGLAEEYRVRSNRIITLAKTDSWSEQNGMFRDGLNHESYSQHTQIWAVLSGTVTGEKARKLMKKSLEEKALAKASYAMSFFLFRALSQSGAYERSFELWDSWKDMVDMNLTTWNEDPVTQRSDCHAWGAVPLYEYCSEILGVKPTGIQDDSYSIIPKPGELEWAKGTVVTNRGEIGVSWKKMDNKIILTISNPSQINLHITLPDGREFNNITDRILEIQ